VKPFVFTNLATTLDGKIADFKNPKAYLGTPFDRQVMQTIRKKADVIVVGASTLRARPHCYTVKSQTKKPQPVNAVITRSGDLDSNIPFWADPDVVRFVFTTTQGFQRASEAAKERAFVVCADDETGHGVDPLKVVNRLAESQLSQILIEGGGEIMGLFLKKNLVDEINLTLTPWFMGGAGNPSLVSIEETFHPWVSLKLKKIKKVKNEIYLNYSVINQRNKRK
jgi:2,5-diamino-6-(ribosylamino)-4(3H)-pyrimidinone 5'-phosphate reductase